jgi:hypothetical protein
MRWMAQVETKAQETEDQFEERKVGRQGANRRALRGQSA